VSDADWHGRRSCGGLLDGVADHAIDVALQLGLVDLDELRGLAGNVSYTTHGSPLGHGLG
jgi:hypothetical protein